MSKIAFIGLGNMGAGMAQNLVKAGHEVRAFDRSEAAMEMAVQSGCIAVKSLSEAIEGAEGVISMLPAGKHVRDVYTGQGGVIQLAEPNAILMDCSTIDVDSARDVIRAASARGLSMVDAPVSGGVGGAKAGNLTFMVGGDRDGFDRAKPYLSAMGKNIFHAGAPGNGQAAKVCNNMLLGISMIATSEAFNLAKNLGLDAQTFFDIASTASGQNWSMTSYCPAPGPVPSAPSNHDYQAGFTAAMMLKDMRLAAGAAQSSDTTTPLGELAKSLYGQMEDRDQAHLDFSAIIKFLDQT